jgi:hypothetical protein
VQSFFAFCRCELQDCAAILQECRDVPALSCDAMMSYIETRVDRSLTQPLVRAPQEEANEHQHDSIPQAAQRMWTSPQRLRKKELCSILNFAVRCDGTEIVQPLAMLVRSNVSLWCATVR